MPTDAPPPTADDTSDQRPLIQLRNVGKTYPGGTQALDGVSCRFSPGEFVSLLGPSGCGKSTILRLIAGLDKPTLGEVDVRIVSAEADPSNESTRFDRPIGCVFQEPTLMPWARVWDNVYLPLRLAGVGRSQAAGRIEAALERVGLVDFARAYPHELSGGMKMRASVARATVSRPRVLMLDEPFAALDEITRFRLNDDLLRLWAEQQWTGLFVTHSVYESVFLSSRVLVMSGRPGRVLEEIDIPLPYPRTDATRATPDYVALCGQVSAALARAMAEPAARETKSGGAHG